MTRLLRLSALCLAAGLVLPPQALAHTAAPSAETRPIALAGAAADAAGVVDAFHAALKAGDTGKAASLMAAGVLVFEAGGAETSKAAYAAEHLPADAAFEATALETILRRSGAAASDSAWIATEGRVQARAGEKVTDRLTTETMILARTAGGWRIVHVHWSSRANPPPR
ncbi:nuclear transport factor 2 family protein [Phenylobacterium sp.]|uniref:nuclear transport factor 2 family protein n=1 Tax=Phenylobacterium sp. TaxID=1871053 RepID=UPI00286A8D6C|nr:nuclear transport factor 2 family protein [Phenylobacterium sp.]